MTEAGAAPGQPWVWALVGATGTGKTALSLDLAARLSGKGRPAEVVNADAMQLYRGMDIGTAKLPASERRGVPHHLFDALHVTDEAAVAWYQPTARGVIEQIHSRGADAILVGGSGLYVSSVIYDFSFPPRDEGLRRELESELAANGSDALLERLRQLDPSTAEAVDSKNPRRVVRALEVALLGANAQVTLPSQPVLWNPRTRVLGTHVERGALVERLDARVRQMWEAGMLDEVRGLIPEGIERGKTASRAIGYAQALAQLHGECDENEAVEQTQALTRRYARRQVSWFKRYADIQWIEPGSGLDTIDV